MKRYLTCCILAVLAAFSITLSSCGNDDEPEKPAPTLIGKWKVSEITTSYNFIYETGLHEGYTFMFSDEGWYAFFEDVGSWSMEGDDITLISNDPDGIPATFRIEKLTDNYLEMKYCPDGSAYMVIKMYRQ
ncbi:MAG: lipocalin family protein [Bacteroidaceae bacterium]|nr:lipocalin family protein [Bacteroidaceae bacterium]